MKKIPVTPDLILAAIAFIIVALLLIGFCIWMIKESSNVKKYYGK